MNRLPIVALIGQTNAGKSSLLNRMARKNIAIVAREEGTTRDNVMATIDDSFILIDTAGRLQNKYNLMQELSKIKSVIDKNAPDSIRESVLVLDANTGPNGLSQAQVFTECVNLTSVALTKLDGSAKGGIIISIAKEMNLPVKLIGVGEKIDDLKDFDSQEFVRALFN